MLICNLLYAYSFKLPIAYQMQMYNVPDLDIPDLVVHKPQVDCHIIFCHL